MTPLSDSSGHKRAAFLTALAFFLSTIEYMLPRPIPFMRIGLANLPILFAVDLLPLGSYCALVFMKVLGMSVLSGSLFSYVALFSLAGTIASAFVMRLARKLFGRKGISYLGLCIAGAMASNGAQVALARIIVFGASARYMAPLFLVLGLASGTVLGIFANIFASRSSWLARQLEQTHGQE